MDGNGETEKNQQGFHLCLRLVTLLNDYGGATLRDIFRRRYENLTNKKWEDGSQTSKDFHKTVGKSVFKSAKPIQRTMLQKGDLNDWDLALVSTVLQNIDYTNGSAEAKEQHENENKAIKELNKVRNSIEHQKGKSISPCDFDTLWKTLADNLVSLDVSAENIDFIRSCTNIHGIEFKPTDENHVNAENYLKAKGLRDEGNAATRSNQLNKAIQLYTKALNLYGVPKGERGMIYSNRSSVYLKLLEENAISSDSEDEVEQNCHLAKEDAEKVIELRPTWWKGYYRLGRVFQFKKEWKSAIVAFNQALGLNMGDKEILNARDACRSKERSQEIQEHIQPCILQNKLDSSEVSEKFRKERGMVGIDVKTMLIHNKFCIDSNSPELQSHGLIISAHRHLLGVDGYKQNYKKAAELFSKAAKIGNADALYNVGLLHEKGMGVVMDFELAVEYFEKAAKCPMDGFLGHNKIGVVAAQYKLGKCYHDGVGKPKDFSEAARWYTIASQNGCGQASNNLGILYDQGFGVEKSLEKAVQYWKLAASTGEILGLENLAWAYLKLGNVDEAEKWFSQSINAGNLCATLEQKKFRKLLELMRQCKTKIKDVTNSSAASGEETGITILQNFAKEMQSLATSRSTLLPGNPPERISDCQSVISKYWTRENEIRLKAAQGFSYAKTILASMEYFSDGIESLYSLKLRFREGNAVKNEMFRAFANCYRVTEIVAFLPLEDKTTLTEIAVKTMSHYKDEVSEVDCDARVCYSIMIYNSLEEAVNFLEVSKIKYPNEVFFPQLQINLLGFLQKFHEALEKCVHTLKQFPNNMETVDLLQARAKLMYFTWDRKDRRNTEETMIAFKTFLDSAPCDHRKVPDAYYCLGYLSLWLQPEPADLRLDEAENYLRAGMDAENNLLSCFIPYDSDHKKFLKIVLDTRRALYKRRVNAKSSEASSKDSNSSGKLRLLQDQGNIHKNEVFKFNGNYDGCLSQMQQTNPMRIQVVLKYRNFFKELKIGRLGVGFSITLPKNEHKLPSQLSGLKEIKLDEMNPTTDHVYSSKVLHATIMEDCIIDYCPSIHTVIKDDNGDFILCYFYNFNQKDAETRKQFSFGSAITILNPYHRLTDDLGHGIRIDDPHCVVFNSTGDDNPLCRFCCKPNPSKRCSKCKRAKYCGRNCQLQDWNMLKHKLICKPIL